MMSKTCFAHAAGVDNVISWYSAASGGTAVTPENGDTLDSNGYTIACGYLIGEIGDTWYLQDSVGTGTFLFGDPATDSQNQGTLHCGSGCNVVFGDATADNSGQNAGVLIMGSGSTLTGNSSSGNNPGGVILCESGSTVVWGDYAAGINSFGNSGLVIVRAGCNFSWTSASDNVGLIVVEAGATGSFTSLQNQPGGILWICSGATANLLTDNGTGGYGGSWNTGMIVVESDGTLSGDATSGLNGGANVGSIIGFQGAIITGNADGAGGALTVIAVPFVRKSANYPAVANVVANAAGAFSAGLGKFGDYDDLVGTGAAELATLNTQKAKIAKGQTITLSGGASQAGQAPAGGGGGAGKMGISI
jgi:hypothetical protein